MEEKSILELLEREREASVAYNKALFRFNTVKNAFEENHSNNMFFVSKIELLENDVKAMFERLVDVRKELGNHCRMVMSVFERDYILNNCDLHDTCNEVDGESSLILMKTILNSGLDVFQKHTMVDEFLEGNISVYQVLNLRREPKK